MNKKIESKKMLRNDESNIHNISHYFHSLELKKKVNLKIDLKC